MKISDIVTMSASGMQKYPSNTIMNPHGIKGKVVQKSGSVVNVLWSNGKKNTYRDTDLILAEEAVSGYVEFLRKVEGSCSPHTPPKQRKERCKPELQSKALFQTIFEPYPYTLVPTGTTSTSIYIDETSEATDESF